MYSRRTSIFRTLTFFATIAFVLLGTYLVIRYAKGDRLGKAGIVNGTGLLAANSFPTSAEVYLNGKLSTATDNTLNLEPGDYLVEVKKDGYHAWSKNLKIEAQLVTSTNAQLFPTSPSLEPLTYIGATQITPSPQGEKLAYVVASASASTKNGLYVQDLTNSPISFNKNARQIAVTSAEYDYTQASFIFSPNSSEILVSFDDDTHLLLSSTQFNDPKYLKDVTYKLTTLLSDWELELARTELVRLNTLPEYFQALATDSASLTNLYFSPDGKKLLYQSLSDLEIPTNLIPALLASNSQLESRSLKAGAWYVYDLKEDKNFLVAEGTRPSPSPTSTPKSTKNTKTLLPPTTYHLPPTKLTLLTSLSPIPAETTSSSSAYKRLQTSNIKDTFKLFNAQYSPIFVNGIQWYPDSSHLIINTDKTIEVMEYDSTNRVTLYAGPFDSSIVYPWPDGSKIITKIQFSPDTLPNLYTIKLK